MPIMILLLFLHRNFAEQLKYLFMKHVNLSLDELEFFQVRSALEVFVEPLRINCVDFDSIPGLKSVLRKFCDFI